MLPKLALLIRTVCIACIVNYEKGLLGDTKKRIVSVWYLCLCTRVDCRQCFWWWKLGRRYHSSLNLLQFVRRTTSVLLERYCDKIELERYCDKIELRIHKCLVVLDLYATYFSWRCHEGRLIYPNNGRMCMFGPCLVLKKFVKRTL